MDKFIGIGIMLISTVLNASLLPILKKPSTQLPPFTMMAITMFVLFSMALIASIIFEQSLSIKQSVLKQNLAPLLIFGFVNFFAFWSFILGIKFFSVWQQQMFGLFIPIFGGILAYFLLGEVLGMNLFIGLVIVSIGLFIGLR